jgi:hypothetical protein
VQSKKRESFHFLLGEKWDAAIPPK